MKALFTISLIVVFGGYYSQARSEIKERTIYFDTLKQGDPCTRDFYIKNVGSEPLIVFQANTSCGCDMGTWPRDPILPGDSGKLNYKYDSNRIGMLNKSMTIKTNDTIEPYIVVKFKGFVLPKESN
ncbi:MAG: DUF1573 domain-containing protein [Flavobacteriales bacterium]|nr:DUF1573 domain-containing protein [Flavobacteriales bacterium]